jgi:hypothetical protein
MTGSGEYQAVIAVPLLEEIQQSVEVARERYCNSAVLLPQNMMVLSK